MTSASGCKHLYALAVMAGKIEKNMADLEALAECGKSCAQSAENLLDGPMPSLRRADADEE